MNQKRRNKLLLKRMAICETAAKIYLYRNGVYSEQNISEFWNYTGFPPSKRTVHKSITNANVKWYIRERMNIDHPIWNGDFIAGMTCSCRQKVSKNRMPWLLWNYNKEIMEMAKECPFSGNLLVNAKNNVYRWGNLAAYCLKSNKDSISYLAGVLSIGKEYQLDGKTYAGYNKKMEGILRAWNIPIEKKWHHSVFISPIWVALLTPWMPESRKKWLKVSNPCMAEEYAFILWRVFTGKDIEGEGIPYLLSRRTFYYRYHTIDNLEKKWVDLKLVELDARFKEVVQKWASHDLPKIV